MFRELLPGPRVASALSGFKSEQSLGLLIYPIDARPQVCITPCHIAAPHGDRARRWPRLDVVLQQAGLDAVAVSLGAKDLRKEGSAIVAVIESVTVAAVTFTYLRSRRVVACYQSC